MFLDLEEEVAKARGGWGEERYEKVEMQREVRRLFLVSSLRPDELGGIVGFVPTNDYLQEVAKTEDVMVKIDAGPSRVCP